jgi:hypothetical protein
MAGTRFSRKALVIALALCFMVALVVKVLAGASAVAMVTGVYGYLSVKHGNETYRGKAKMALYNGDMLTTDGRSKAVILLRDNTEIKMDRETTITLNIKEKQKGILVTLGKIWADITKKQARFEIGSPHGAAAIEGTQLQYEVSDNDSTCAVMKGKVRFYNDKSKVALTSGRQSSSSSRSGTLTPARAVELKRLIAWQNDILKYSQAIPRFTELFNQALSKKAASGTGSLHGAEDEIEGMKTIQALVESMVPDDEMLPGHNKLKGAFAKLMCYLAIVPNTPEQQASANKFRSEAESDMAMAQTYLQKWINGYNATEQRFLTNPSFNPPPVK